MLHPNRPMLALRLSSALLHAPRPSAAAAGSSASARRHKRAPAKTKTHQRQQRKPSGAAATAAAAATRQGKAARPPRPHALKPPPQPQQEQEQELPTTDAECAAQLRRLGAGGALQKRPPLEVLEAVTQRLRAWGDSARGAQTAAEAIKILSSHRLDKVCLRMWERDVQAAGRVMPKEGYDALIRVCSASGNLAGVRRVWGEMKAFGVPASRGTLHAVARCLVRRGYRAAAHDGVVRSTRLLNHATDVVTLRTALSSCGSAREALLYLGSLKGGAGAGGVAAGEEEGAQASEAAVATTVNPQVVEDIIRVSARSGHALVVEAMLRALPPGFPGLRRTDRARYALLLTAYVQAQDLRGAQFAWARLRMFGSKRGGGGKGVKGGDASGPHPADATALLRGCCREVERLMAELDGGGGGGGDSAEIAGVVAYAEDVFAGFREGEEGDGEGGGATALKQPRLLTAMMRVYAKAGCNLQALSLYKWVRQNGVQPTEPFMQQVRHVLQPREI